MSVPAPELVKEAPEDPGLPTNLQHALWMLQCQVQGVLRDSTNSHFDSSYASLTAVWNELRPHFQRLGLLVTISPGKLERLDEKVYVVPVTAAITYIPTAETIVHEMAMPVSKLDPQGYASAITYSQRYLLMTVFSLPPHDDDGQAAGGMSPDDLQNYQAGLEACESMQDLRELFSEAYRAGASDPGALKALAKVKDLRKSQLDCRDAVDKHWDMLQNVRDAIAAGDLREAVGAYDEIPQDDQLRLSLAPSKGGFFTTEEVKVMKSNDWHAARRANHGDGSA